jgi:hypothetical protein
MKRFVTVLALGCVWLMASEMALGQSAAAGNGWAPPGGNWVKWADTNNGLPVGGPIGVRIDPADPDMILAYPSAPRGPTTATSRRNHDPDQLISIYQARLSDKVSQFKLVFSVAAKDLAKQWPETNPGTSMAACRAASGRLLNYVPSFSDHHVYESPGYGGKWTALSSLDDFCACPGPLPPKAKFVGGPPLRGSNASVMMAAVGWIQVGKLTTPWGEVFLGTETGGLWHSLDDGKTWVNLDLNFYQPQRDASGFPAYCNPGYPDPAAGMHGGFANCFPTTTVTKDGEVLLGDEYHNCMYTSDGRTVATQQLMSIHGTGTRDGRIYDLLSKKDGAKEYGEVLEWNDVGAPYAAITRAGQPFTPAPYPVSDGVNVYIGSDKGEIWKWTPSSPGPVMKMEANKTIACPGSVTVSGTVGEGDWKYAWRSRGLGDVTFTTPLAASTQAYFSAPGDYVLNLRAVNGSRSTGNCMMVHVKAKEGGEAPKITAQPTPTTALTAGKAASFSVTATGTGPLHYQWYRNGFKIVGAKEAAYTIPAEEKGGTFHCVISSPYGRVASNCATIGLPPQIIGQPPSQTVAEDSEVTFSVAASGLDPLTWQWRKDGQAIAGANKSSYTIKAVNAADAGDYTVVVSNIIGSQASDKATLAIGAGAARHKLTINSNASTASTSGLYAKGQVVPIFSGPRLIDPASEKFVRWKVQGADLQIADATSNATTIVMPDGDVSLTSSYADAVPGILAKRLTVVNGNGAGSFMAGDAVTIEAAEPPVGMAFEGWSGGPAGVDGSTKPTFTFLMPAENITIWATYKPLSKP